MCFIEEPFNLPQIQIAFLNIVNVHTVSVDFLRILDAMGVEARTTQYDKSESSHFLFNIIKTIKSC